MVNERESECERRIQIERNAMQIKCVQNGEKGKESVLYIVRFRENFAQTLL